MIVNSKYFFVAGLFLTVGLVTLSACKKDNPFTKESPKPDAVPAETQAPAPSQDLPQNNPVIDTANNAAPLQELPEAAAHAFYAVFEAEQVKNKAAINRCYEEYAINFFKTASEATIVDGFKRDIMLEVKVDKNGNVVDAINKYSRRGTEQLSECLAGIVKTFKFVASGREMTEYHSLRYDNGSKALEIQFDNGIRKCFENHYMDHVLKSDDKFCYTWVIDPSGTAKNIKYLGKSSVLEPPQNAPEFDTLSQCIGDVILHETFSPTVTNQDVPFYYEFNNPYSYDIMDFEEEKEDALKQCAKDIRMSQDWFGFTWVIMPDGSITDIKCDDPNLNNRIKDCYIDLLKNWRFKPTMSGAQLNMYYEFEIGEEEDDF